MKIAVDADDTLFNYWLGVVTPKVQFEYGVDLPWQDGDTWDDNPVKNFFSARGESWWDWMQEHDWLWAQCEPFPGAIGCIRDWRRQEHFIEILTKKPTWAEWTVHKMVGLWRIPVDRVTMVPLKGKKHEVTDAELLIDDSPDNIKDWLTWAGPAIMFERPWNKEKPPGQGGGFRIARHWGEVRDLVTEFDKLGRFVDCR